ncbi:MAG: RNA-binding S4 domain-containing protein [Armatimonadia bacterium]|nr:RNA-binding S4 domain-containing protein [Armatimonadia bacterium]
MRLDKFLKDTGIIRRRTVAKDLADANRIQIDGRQARASATVRPGQRLTLDLGRKVATYEILAIPERTPRKNEAEGFVRLVDEEIREDW